jgi:hypothetical protein
MLEKFRQFPSAFATRVNDIHILKRAGLEIEKKQWPSGRLDELPVIPWGNPDSVLQASAVDQEAQG